MKTARMTYDQVRGVEIATAEHDIFYIPIHLSLSTSRCIIEIKYVAIHCVFVIIRNEMCNDIY